MKFSRSRGFAAFFSVVSFSGFTCQSGWAADLYWDAGATVWSSNLAWATDDTGATNPANAPGSGDKAIFNITSLNTAQTVNLDQNEAVSGLVFNSTGTTLIQSDSATQRTLAIGADGIVVNATGGNVTLGASGRPLAVNLAAAQSWNVGTDRTLTVLGPVTGSSALTKTGAGTLTLGGTVANTFSGVTTVSGGTLSLSKSAGVNAIAGDVAVTAGSLIFNASNQLADTSNISLSGGSVNFNTRSETLGNVTISGGSMSTGSATNTINVVTTSITSGGSTRLTLNSGSTYSTTTLSTGGSAQGLGATAGGNILVGAGSVTSLVVGSGGMTMTGQNIQYNYGNSASRLVLNGDFTGSGTNQITYATGTGTALSFVDLGGSVRTFDITGGSTTIGLITTNGSLTKNGTGTLVLSGANTYAGNTLVNAGILNIRNNTALGTTAGTTTVAANATVQLQGNITVTGETLNLTATPNNGNLAGLSNISGDNRWTGDINLDLTQTANNARLSISDGTLEVRNVNISAASSGVGLVLTGNGGVGTVAGVITGTGTNQNVIKTGESTWVLAAAYNYTGFTRVDGGVLSVSSVATNLGSSTGDISLGDGGFAGTLRHTGNGEVITRGFDFRSGGVGGGIEQAGTGVLVIREEVSSTTASALNKTFTLSGSTAGTGVVSGNISDANGTATTSLTKSGTGTWTISGTNSYEGATTVTGGTLNVSTSIITSSSVNVTGGKLALGASGVIGSSAAVSLGTGGILQTAGFDNVMGVLTATGNGTIDLTGDSIITFADSSSSIWSGTLAITGWDGLSTGGDPDERVSFTVPTGLTAQQLAQVTFIDPVVDGIAQTGTYSAQFVGSAGEIVPGVLIPEPSAVLAAILGSAGFVFRRRRIG